MNNDLENFRSKLNKDDLVHFICNGATIIGKFSRNEKESVVLTLASVFGERLAGETSVDINEIVAWGYGGKYN